MKKATLLLALMLICWAGNAWALNAEEYRAWMANSPELAKAQEQLRAAFEAAKNTLPKQEFEVLVNEQKLWVPNFLEKVGPKVVVSRKVSLPEAYAILIKYRAEDIQDYLKEEARTPFTFTGLFVVSVTGDTMGLMPLGNAPPSTLDIVRVAPAGTNHRDIQRVCQTTDICTVTGVLNVDRDVFATVTQVTLVEKKGWETFIKSFPPKTNATARAGNTKGSNDADREWENKERDIREKTLLKELARIRQMSLDLLR